MNEMRRNDVDALVAAGSTKNKPRVAVVILNWNGKSFLEKFLPSVIQSTFSNLEIIVADNASTDDSVSFVKEKFPSVKTWVNKTNEGFAGGYNRALKEVNADIYVLLNSDVEVESGWIEPVVALMESNRKIAACQPKVLSYHDKNKYEYAGAAGGWIDRFGYPFARGRVFDDCEVDHGQYDNAIPCFWATGAAMFVRAENFHAAGGFDAAFFAHQEEIDLCWRLKRKGWEVYVQPASVVYHVGGGTLANNSPAKTFLNFRNNLLMLYKNLPKMSLLILLIRILMDWLAALQMLFRGDAKNAWAVIHAHWGFWIFTLGGKVKRRTPDPKPDFFKGMYAGSVVFDYFIKKKKQFSEIVEVKS